MDETESWKTKSTEFLMTYGWAILVVLVMIGALAYFGMLNPAYISDCSCQTAGADKCQIIPDTENQINTISCCINATVIKGTCIYTKQDSTISTVMYNIAKQ